MSIIYTGNARTHTAGKGHAPTKTGRMIMYMKKAAAEEILDALKADKTVAGQYAVGDGMLSWTHQPKTDTSHGGSFANFLFPKRAEGPVEYSIEVLDGKPVVVFKEAQSASGDGNTQTVPGLTASAPTIVKQSPAPRLTAEERGFLIKTGHRKPTGYKPTPNSSLDGVERTESNKTNGLVDHSDIYFGKKVFQYQNTCPTCGNNCDDKWVKSTVNGEIKRVRLEKEHKDANRENNSQENIDAKCNICNQKAKQNGKFDGNSDPLLATAVSEQWKYWEDAVLPAEFRKWLNDNNKQIIR